MNSKPCCSLITQLAIEISHLPISSTPILRIGIDGVDGSGKTTFADQLAKTLETTGASVIRASVDGFHNPREIRYQRGRLSPEGFYLDSYNYTGLKQNLLDPLSINGSGLYRTAIFDHITNQTVDTPWAKAKPKDILIFDGIFIHRPELCKYWDFSIFLHVDFEVSIPRLGKRDNGSTDINAAINRRYIEGQQFYLQQCSPLTRATVVLDNNNWSRPLRIR